MPRPRVALATCRDVHGLAPDDRPLVPALADRGIDAEAAVWDDPDADWASYDLVVVRSTWDISTRREEFLAWAHSVPRLANSATVIEWNTDRRYMKALDESGVPVIPTIWLDPSHHLSKRAVHSRMPAFGDFVVKPVVSAGAKDIGRYQPVSAQSRAKAIQHTVRLLDSGRWVMIQPYVTSIDTAGETCLIFVDGVYQHAVRRHALLGGLHHNTVGLSLYPNDTTRKVEATAQQIEVADHAFAVARQQLGLEPHDDRCLYARVDLVEGDDGPLVIELELVEPTLWMRFSGKNPTLHNLADAIARRCTNVSA